MIDKLIAWSLRHRGVVLTVTALLTLASVLSLVGMPVDAIPDLSENQVLVMAEWPGRSPREIEAQVTSRITTKLRGITGVRTVRAMSEPSFAMVDVLFEDGVSRVEARRLVADRLSAAEGDLPEGVRATLGPDGTAVGQIFWYTLEGDGFDLGELRTTQDVFVRPALASLPGVAEVASVGGMAREWQVDVDPERLRSCGVSLAQVRDALARAGATIGARTVTLGSTEHMVRGVATLATQDDLEALLVLARDDVPVRIGDVATVALGPQFRRSVLEKDGGEAVGGVVLMRDGGNPLAITEALHEKIREISPGLPAGMRIVPFYERTRLVRSAVATVTRTIVVEVVVAALAIFLVMLHVGASAVVCLTLPLAILGALALMRAFGVSANIMPLCGIAVSVGVLVDQGIVLTDNAMHRLRERFGTEPVRGDVTELLIAPCQEVGRPIFFAVLIMVVSFLPVFALSGIEGRMFHPLAWTKTFALVGVGILTVTLLPALLPVVLRGRMRSEEQSWLVRSVVAVYRPVLAWLLPRHRGVVLAFAALLAAGVVVAQSLGTEFMPPLDEGHILDMPVTAPGVTPAQVANDLRARDAVLRSFPEIESVVGKAGRAETATDPSPIEMVETIVALRPSDAWPARHLDRDEALDRAGHVIDLLTTNGALGQRSAAEQEMFQREVTDGASGALDAALRRLARTRQIEAARRLGEDLVAQATRAGVQALRATARLTREPSAAEISGLTAELVRVHAPPLVAGAGPLRADVDQLLEDVERRLAALGCVSDGSIVVQGGEHVGSTASVPSRLAPKTADRLHAVLTERHELGWENHARSTRGELERFAPRAFTWAAVGSALEVARERGRLGREPGDAEQAEIADCAAVGWTPWLRAKTKAELVEELDRTLRVPGWANIWTQPIVNRVDMLSTGIRTIAGVKVLGTDPATLDRVAEEVAAVVRRVPGAADVVVDRSAGRGYVEIEVDPARAERFGLHAKDVMDVVGVALGGTTAAEVVSGGQSTPVRLRYTRDARSDLDAIRRVLIPVPHAAGDSAVPAAAVSGTQTRTVGAAHGMGHGAMTGRARQTAATAAPMAMDAVDAPDTAAGVQVPLDEVATVRVVEGPSQIFSEDGARCTYVQVNVRDRDVVGFVEDAQRRVGAEVSLASGTRLVWSGQFEHQVRARRTLSWVVPVALILIMIVLWLTYRDVAHAFLMLLAVPGALAGGVFLQALLGFDFSVAVWVGYVACFGMATQTGIVMLVYLREALARAGGVANIASEARLREVVLEGAVRRMRPKLLTEATTILGLAPMLFMEGAGSEIMRPMAAPVLGGILVADEVVDVFLPVLFLWVERRRWRRIAALGAGDAAASPL